MCQCLYEKDGVRVCSRHKTLVPPCKYEHGKPTRQFCDTPGHAPPGSLTITMAQQGQHFIDEAKAAGERIQGALKSARQCAGLHIVEGYHVNGIGFRSGKTCAAVPAHTHMHVCMPWPLSLNLIVSSCPWVQ